MILKRHTKLAFLLLHIFILSFGCESGKDDNVTGTLFYRKPGELKNFTVDPDSIRIGTLYNYEIGKIGKMFAGQYENVTAFSVFKFIKPDQSVLDSLVSAKIRFTVQDVWKKGDLEFGLYNTTSDWSDDNRLDPDMFLSDIVSPISVVSDTSTSLSSLTFDLSIDNIASWSEYGSLLITNTESGMGMVSLSSDNSSSSPALVLITESASGLLDTTTVRSGEGTYYIDPGVDTGKILLADANASGFVLHIAVPDFYPSPTNLHRCTLQLNIRENLIATSAMSIIIQQLSKEFTTIEEASTEYGTAIDTLITPGVTTYSIDISRYIDSWHNLGKPNYGLLFKPSTINSSPNYAVIEPGDSLVIEYTTLPEVE